MTHEQATEDAATGRFSSSGEGWMFNGALTLDDASTVFEAAQSLALPVNGVIDFTGLKHADCAALAMMIALKRRGNAEGRTLTIRGMPASLRSLAVVYGVENLLD